MRYYYLLWLLVGLALSSRAQSLDPTFQPTSLLYQSTSASVLALAAQADGKVLAAGNFQAAGGALSNNVLRLNADLSRDLSFRPALGANGQVQALAVQPDGKVLIGGSFSTYAGTATGPVARLLPTGELDPAFRPDPTLAGGQVAALAVQADGGILVGGPASASLPGGLVRLLPTGALDPAFSSGSGAGSGGQVLALVVQPADGRIVVGGSFASFGGRTSPSLVRLLPSGAPDPDFAPPPYPAGEVTYCVAVLASGTILAGGYGASGNLRGFLPSGAPDARFSLDFISLEVRSIQVDAAGRIMVAGYFSYLISKTFFSTPGVVRLLADGTPDPTFAPRYSGAYYNSMLPLADGRVLLGGYTPVGTAVGLLLLSATGALDSTFNLGLQLRGSVSQVVLQADGTLLVQGAYTTFNGQAVRGQLQRLGPDGRLVQDRLLPAVSTSISTVGSLFPQPDGQVYAAVAVGRCNGDCGSGSVLYSFYLRHILADNSLDLGFNVPLPSGAIYAGPSLATRLVQQLVVLPTGELLALLNRSTIGYGDIGFTLLKIQPTGASEPLPLPALLQQTQSLAIGRPVPQIRQLLPQPDGKLLVGYDMVTPLSSSVSTRQSNLTRVLPDGTVDPSFAVTPAIPADVALRLGPLQPDGKLFVSGAFTAFAGVPAPTGLVRLLPSGAVDATFQPAANLAPLVPLALRPDGRLLVQANAQPGTARLRYLLPEGTPDATFVPVAVTSAGYPVTSWNVVLQPSDNKPVLYGDFTEVAGQPRTGLARLGAASALASRPASAAGASLYPNPAHHQATLQLTAPLGQASRVQLFDALGREVYQQLVPAHTAEVPLALDGLRPGLYLLRCGSLTRQLAVE